MFKENRMTISQELIYRQLKAMDKVIRMHTNDECYIESWLMTGIPDGSTDLDFQEYAKDEDDYTEFSKTFIFINSLASKASESCSIKLSIFPCINLSKS